MQINSINLENLYHLPCAVFWKDKNGIIRECNDYYADIWLKGTDFIDKTVADLVPVGIVGFSLLRIILKSSN